jgi:quercetin dioxygenase-like cupin family protein
MRAILTSTGVVLALLLTLTGTAVSHDDMGAEVALDSPSVKVALVTVPAGASSGIHLNPEPELVIVVEGELTLVTRYGKEVLKPGRVVYLQTGTGHEVRNESTQPVKLWAASLKKCE